MSKFHVMENQQELLARLPKIDVLLKSDEAAGQIPILGRQTVVDICREAVQRTKQAILERGARPEIAEIKTEISQDCARARSQMLGPVINGTGVLLHTNLGRAPLGRALFGELSKTLESYCNLEIDVLDRKRSARGTHVVRLLRQVCNAEDAVIVNNNAAALFLLLREFATDTEVVVSRGELVQIGGGFRIPDILTSSGARLREVGTTNITTTEDYQAAVGESTALLLKVHRSNFHMDGFARSPDIAELCRLKNDRVLLVSDLGSGNLVRYIAGTVVDEPTPSDHLLAGADLVCFSCDKMLGGVQAGVIAGRADLIDRLRKNPIMRVVRVDKTTYAALQIVLTHHLNGEPEKVQLWAMAVEKQEEVKRRILQFITEHGFDGSVFTAVECMATFGGGSTPGHKIASAALRIHLKTSPDKIASALQTHHPPVIGVVREGYFEIDFRTVLPWQQETLAGSLKWLTATQG